MVFTKITPKNWLKNRYILFCSVVIAIFTTSCSQPDPNQRGYSAHFKKILDTVNYISDKHPEQGVKYLDSALKTVADATVSDNFRRLSFHFMLEHRARRNFRRSLVYADSMLNYVNINGGQTKYPTDFAEANFAKGDAFFELHDYNDAYRYYYYGYEVGKDHLDKNLLSGYSYRMGMITFQQSNYTRSADFFKESYAQSLPYDKDFVVFFRNQEVLDNTALAYRHMNKTDSALAYFNKALNYIIKKEKDFPKKKGLLEVAKAVIIGNQADIYINNGDHDTAAGLLRKSIEVNIKKDGDNSDGLLSEIKLARIYKEQDRQKEFCDLLDTIHAQLENIPDNVKSIDNRRVEADWYLLKSYLYEKQNALDLALRYDQRHDLLKDSISENIRKLKEISVTDKFDNYDKDNQIEALTRYSRLQQIYLLVLLLAGLLALVIIFMIYRNWRNSKKEISIVSSLNNEVNKQKIDLEHTLDKLNKSSQEKDRILHTVAHDLRNPLGGIASLANIMAEDDLDEQVLEYTNLIKETADNSLQLINEIFEATDAGIGEIKFQPVEINSLLNNAVELLKFKAAEKNQQIILKPLAKPETIIAGREKLWRVVSNIIVNAIKFSPVNTDIIIESKITEKDVIIRIADHGIGIPDSLKPKIFNMFTEAKRIGTMGERSFGLGLSICKQIIEKHGGQLWLEDNAGGGSVFCISLKRKV